MWDFEFGVVEQARANRHGRSDVRREERVRSDVAVTVVHDGHEVANGWCLDRSSSGARVILCAADGCEIGRGVTICIDGETVAFRVVWAYVQGDTCVLGLERGRIQSGEFPIAAIDVPEATLISAA